MKFHTVNAFGKRVLYGNMVSWCLKTKIKQSSTSSATLPLHPLSNPPPPPFNNPFSPPLSFLPLKCHNKQKKKTKVLSVLITISYACFTQNRNAIYTFPKILHTQNNLVDEHHHFRISLFYLKISHKHTHTTIHYYYYLFFSSFSGYQFVFLVQDLTRKKLTKQKQIYYIYTKGERLLWVG